ncbi:MAG TPA: hypothetical protein VHP12_08140 [Chitinophagaceae bacterium]|nr:hypothetical protein [Chitinophagaceae bacterium]
MFTVTFFYTIYSEDNNSVILKEALECLPKVLNEIYSFDKTEYGFLQEDKIEDATLNDIFIIYTLKADKLNKYKKGDSIAVLIDDELKVRHSIVMCKTQPRAVVTIAKINGRYEIVELRALKEIEMMVYTLLKAYEKIKCFFLMCHNEISTYFI